MAIELLTIESFIRAVVPVHRRNGARPDDRVIEDLGLDSLDLLELLTAIDELGVRLDELPSNDGFTLEDMHRVYCVNAAVGPG